MRKFYKVSYAADGIIPTRSDAGSAGYDFYSPVDVTIEPQTATIIKTNIKAQMENDEVLLIYVRSSIGIKRHLSLSNGTGVIDSTYYNNPDNECNIMVALYNYGSEVQTIKSGERFCQGVFTKFLITSDDKPINSQRTGGIGSSGK